MIKCSFLLSDNAMSGVTVKTCYSILHTIMVYLYKHHIVLDKNKLYFYFHFLQNQWLFKWLKLASSKPYDYNTCCIYKQLFLITNKANVIIVLLFCFEYVLFYHFLPFLFTITLREMYNVYLRCCFIGPIHLNIWVALYMIVYDCVCEYVVNI